MILRARFAWTGQNRIAENALLQIENGSIIELGPAGSPSPSATLDLGDAVLLPGLINAHCHLDYTEMAGMLPPPNNFPDWIKSILALKAQWSYSEYAHSWVKGAEMLLRHGVTSVADVEAVPELLPEVWSATPLRVVSFLELTGVKSRTAAPRLMEAARQKIESLPSGRCFAGLSPHSPYATLPDLLRLSSETARAKGWITTIHVAESIEEFEMFMRARGPLYEWLKSQRDCSDCGAGSPVQRLAATGALSPNLLAVHANYLAPGDADLLAREKVSVVHCPRSHQYFGHHPFPLAELESAGVNLCLGTDSLVTVLKDRKNRAELDLFAEMRQFLKANPGFDPQKLLHWVTAGAAKALDAAGQLGELIPGARADVIALPCSGRKETLFEEIIAHRGPVRLTMIEGEIRHQVP